MQLSKKFVTLHADGHYLTTNIYNNKVYETIIYFYHNALPCAFS